MGRLVAHGECGGPVPDAAVTTVVVGVLILLEIAGVALILEVIVVDLETQFCRQSEELVELELAGSVKPALGGGREIHELEEGRVVERRLGLSFHVAYGSVDQLAEWMILEWIDIVADGARAPVVETVVIIRRTIIIEVPRHWFCSSSN
jgi:hypothetical protein